MLILCVVFWFRLQENHLQTRIPALARCWPTLGYRRGVEDYFAMRRWDVFAIFCHPMAHWEGATGEEKLFADVLEIRQA